MLLFNVVSAGPAAAVQKEAAPPAQVAEKKQNKVSLFFRKMFSTQEVQYKRPTKEPARFFSFLKQHNESLRIYSINYNALKSPMPAMGQACAIEAVNVSDQSMAYSVSQLSSYSKGKDIAKTIKVHQAKIRTMISVAGGLLMAAGGYLAFNYGQLTTLSSTVFALPQNVSDWIPGAAIALIGALVILWGVTYKVQKKLIFESKKLLAELGISLNGKGEKKDV